MLSYPDTLDYLFALHRFGIKLGLEAITNLLDRLGHPQRQYTTLHIGGTNGKGSSAAMLAAMLQAGGYRVGLYTSPHLIDFRERIRVDDEEISEADVCELTARIRHIADSSATLTFFELTTVMAFQYFQDQQVDIAIIEVGLGGRYDATNVLDPLGVLITGIGFDHQVHLGHSLPEIAKEKAGILHHKKPVVLGEMPDSAKRVFEERAQAHGAPIFRYEQEFSLSNISSTTFTYHGIQRELSGLQTNLLGRHQMNNAACVLALLETAVVERFPLSNEAMTLGLQQVQWRGRLEVVQYDPMVIIDGAHNPLGAKMLIDFLQSQLHDSSDRNVIVVLGMMEDKQHAEYIKILLPLIDTVILTQPKMNRAASVEVLRTIVPWEGLDLHVISDSWSAYTQALQVARHSDIICVTGSLFLVGEILQRLPYSPSSMSRN